MAACMSDHLARTAPRHGNEWAWHRKSRGVWVWHRKPFAPVTQYRTAVHNFSMPLLGQARARVESHAGAGGETSEQARQILRFSTATGLQQNAWWVGLVKACAVSLAGLAGKFVQNVSARDRSSSLTPCSGVRLYPGSGLTQEVHCRSILCNAGAHGFRCHSHTPRDFRCHAHSFPCAVPFLPNDPNIH